LIVGLTLRHFSYTRYDITQNRTRYPTSTSISRTFVSFG